MPDRFIYHPAVAFLLLIFSLLANLITPNSAPAAVGMATGMGKASACRQMLIYLTNYYGPVQRVTLNQGAGNIKHMYWFKSGSAQRLRITYHNNQRQEIRLMWNPDAIKGFSFWCAGSEKCITAPGLENQDYVLNFAARFNNQPTPLACSTYQRGGFPGKVLFNNFNGNAADVRPTKRTVFRLTGRCTITEVQTLHHNLHRGKIPGKIFIRGVNGARGSWAFKARPGLGTWQNYYLPNCNWIANPAKLTLGPGAYEITVSDPASWSQNRTSGHAGFAIVWGRCSAAPRPTTTTTTQPPPPTTAPSPTPSTDTSQTQPTASLGDWKWFTGGRVRLAENGGVYVYDQNKGQWMASQGSHWCWKDRSKGTIAINWNNNNYIDTLTLSRDGNRLDGKNQNGSRVWATRHQAPAPTTTTTTLHTTTTTTLPPAPQPTQGQNEAYFGGQPLQDTSTIDWDGDSHDFARVSDNLTFHVGMGKGKWGFGYAGVLLQGVQSLDLNIIGAPASYAHYDANSFAGFVIDYGVGDGFAKRVYLGIGMLDRRRNAHYKFADSLAPPVMNYHDLGRQSSYSLNLATWAPQNWNGRVWFGVGVQNIGSYKELKAQITSLH